MQIDKTIFRAYDIRGLVDQNFGPQVLREIGKALGSLAQAQGIKTVLVARDGRLSGPELLAALNDGLLSTGCDVIDIGLAPTPVLYFATRFLGESTGFMLTGSHNPAEYNGLKIMMNGLMWYGQYIQDIYETIQAQHYHRAVQFGRYSTQNLLKPYVDFIHGQLNIQTTKKLKVILDCGNGVTGVIAPALYERLGFSVQGLHTEVDGLFPNHHPDPGQPENLSDLIQAVVSQQADLGLAFDGDGDRLGVVDNTGQIIYADRVLMLFAQEILKKEPQQKILFDIKSSAKIFKHVEQYGGQAEICPTGHSLIKAKMKETGAVLGGEFSGHFFFKANHCFDDALYAGAQLLKILSQSSLSAEQLFEDIPKTVSTPEIMISVSELEKFSIIQHLQEQAHFPGAEVRKLDGLRVDFKDGFALIRASNTSANLVIRLEGEDEASLLRIEKLFKDFLGRSGYHFF